MIQSPGQFSCLNWEVIERVSHQTHSEYFMNIIRRAQVPGGWLVHTYRELSRYAEAEPENDQETTEDSTDKKSIALGVGEGAGIAFIPDAKHAWLSSLKQPQSQAAAVAKASPKQEAKIPVTIESKGTLTETERMSAEELKRAKHDPFQASSQKAHASSGSLAAAS